MHSSYVCGLLNPHKLQSEVLQYVDDSLLSNLACGPLRVIMVYSKQAAACTICVYFK